EEQEHVNHRIHVEDLVNAIPPGCLVDPSQQRFETHAHLRARLADLLAHLLDNRGQDVLVLAKVLGDDEHVHGAATPSGWVASSKATASSSHPDSCSRARLRFSSTCRAAGMSRILRMRASG